jgi:hypothetical protein
MSQQAITQLQDLVNKIEAKAQNDLLNSARPINYTPQFVIEMMDEFNAILNAANQQPDTSTHQMD